jgi:hypothetical protein
MPHSMGAVRVLAVLFTAAAVSCSGPERSKENLVGMSCYTSQADQPMDGTFQRCSTAWENAKGVKCHPASACEEQGLVCLKPDGSNAGFTSCEIPCDVNPCPTNEESGSYARTTCRTCDDTSPAIAFCGSNSKCYIRPPTRHDGYGNVCDGSNDPHPCTDSRRCCPDLSFDGTRYRTVPNVCLRWVIGDTDEGTFCGQSCTATSDCVSYEGDNARCCGSISADGYDRYETVDTYVSKTCFLRSIWNCN